MRRKLRINSFCVVGATLCGCPGQAHGPAPTDRSHLIFMNYDLRMLLRRGCYNNRKSTLYRFWCRAKTDPSSLRKESLGPLRVKGSSCRAKTRHAGLTLTEVVIASALLIIAMVPILKGLTSAHLGSVIIERKSRSLVLAQAELDEIKARSVYHYSDTFAQSDVPLDGPYLCNVEDSTISLNLRKITVSVGYDLNDNNTLEPDEIEVTLATCAAKRWDS